MKSHSSKWMKTKHLELGNFYLHHGEGVFSVNYTEVDVVNRYFRNQKAHHDKEIFQDSYRDLMHKHNMKYDERSLRE